MRVYTECILTTHKLRLNRIVTVIMVLTLIK